jgi:epoxyqueuosine reductase
MSTLVERIKQDAFELGFDVVGIAPAEPAEHLHAYLEWLEAGYHGEQAYLARPDRLARRRDLQVVLPGVRSIIVVGLHYWRGPPSVQAADPGYGRISCYAHGTDYHHVMLLRLQRLLASASAHAGRPLRGRAYVDTGPLLEREHAARAGLGFVGKNTNLIRPSRGSWLFLGELLIDLELEPDVPAPMPTCGVCRRCQDACPTGAFVEPFVLDSRRCISYLTTALKGSIPREFRSLMGNHIFGCDVCQTVCPWNRFAVPLEAGPAQQAPPLLELLALSAFEFRNRYGQSPVGHIGYERWMRNVAVAAGNWAAPQAGRPLAHLMATCTPLVRAHAAWALGRVDTARARDALSRALSSEADPAVRQEIALALNSPIRPSECRSAESNGSGTGPYTTAPRE